MESYNALRDQLDLHKEFPYSPNWSAAADFLQLIVDHCLQHRPDTVFECSSGLTTLMLARCCQINGRGHVYSLENGEEYAESSRKYIGIYGLTPYASVIHAPLEPVRIHDTEYQWYRTTDLPACNIDMLVIDGPPGFMQKHARYPALPLLHDRLSEQCTVFLDDAAREDEKEIVEMWQREYTALEHHYLETERGCSILTVEIGHPSVEIVEIGHP